MKYFKYFILLFCLCVVSECKVINFPDPKHSFLSNLTITTQYYLFKTNLKGSSSDVDLDSVNIYKDCEGHKYCAQGYVKVKNADRYSILLCDFSEDKPTYDDILYFKDYYISSSVNIDIYTSYDVDYFSCFVCDENGNCNGTIKKLSISTGVIVGIVIGVVIILLVCCGCCFGIYKYKHKTLNTNIRMGSIKC